LQETFACEQGTFSGSMISLMEIVFETSDLEIFQYEMATFQTAGMETFQTDAMKIYQYDGLETSVCERLNSERQQLLLLLLLLELEIFGSFSLAVQQKNFKLMKSSTDYVTFQLIKKYTELKLHPYQDVMYTKAELSNPQGYKANIACPLNKPVLIYIAFP
jgi:hypothetical protein